MSYLLLFVTVICSNASFTMVSRARNGKSLTFHAVAASLSNGLWLAGIGQVVTNITDWRMYVTYFFASVIGSVAMHHISMKHIEKRVGA